MSTEFCHACWLKRYDAVLELMAVLNIAHFIYVMGGGYDVQRIEVARLYAAPEAIATGRWIMDLLNERSENEYPAPTWMHYREP